MRRWMLALGLTAGCAEPNENGDSRTLVSTPEGSTGQPDPDTEPPDTTAADSGVPAAIWCALEQEISHSGREEASRLVDTPEGPFIVTDWESSDEGVEGSLRVLAFSGFGTWDTMVFERRFSSDVNVMDIHDIDGDGWPDVVAFDEDARDWRWYRGGPGPSYEPHRGMSRLSDPVFLDFSGDGYADVLDSMTTQPTPGIGNGAGAFDFVSPLDGRYFEAFAVSPTRLLTLSQSSAEADLMVDVLELDPSGAVGQRWRGTPAIRVMARHILAVEDRNADGMDDVLLWTGEMIEVPDARFGWDIEWTAQWAMPRSNGDIAFVEVESLIGSHDPVDLDGDGMPDLLTETGPRTWNVRFWDGDGFGPPEGIEGQVRSS